MTGSRAQLYNGIALLFTFFCCRLLWGTYQSIRVYQDIWAALHYQPPVDKIDLKLINSDTVDTTGIASKRTSDSIHQLHLMGYSNSQYVPIWLSLIYLGSNLVLNFLNFYWFRLMITTLRKRFDHKDTKSIKLAVNGTSKSHEVESNLRKRNTLRKTLNPDQ